MRFNNMLNTICVVIGFHIVFKRFNVGTFHISLFYYDILLTGELDICILLHFCCI